ncbi:hypothetical protein GC173_03505 [bacterium]|nr:hypothetical protein [bacterium]
MFSQRSSRTLLTYRSQSLTLALFCLALAEGASAQQWQSFSSATSFAVSVAPTDLIPGDFNGDGITDLAVANAGANSVSILIGNEDAGDPGSGDGTFAAPVNYAVEDWPTTITKGDFNGDGVTDLAVSNADANTISVLLGNEDAGNPGFGDGTFATHAPFASGNLPQGIATGDFNGDGIADLVVANGTAHTISVLLGNEDVGNAGFGDGTFATPVAYGVGTSPIGVSTADFNGDGIADLVSANLNASTVSVLLGNEDVGNPGFGDGTFASQVTYAVGSGPRSVTTGDFNGDSIVDIAVTSSSVASVSVLLGNEDAGNPGFGDGTFAAHTTYTVGTDPTWIIAADFNGDGITDLATANFLSDNISVLVGNEDAGSPGLGDGTFASHVTYSSGSAPSSVTTGDFDGDGINDLAVVNQFGNQASVLLNLGFNDITAPTSAATGPTGTLSQASSIIPVAFTSSDNHLGATGVASVELFYQHDGGGFVSFGTFSSSPINFDTSGTGGDGAYDFYTVATDGASNAEIKTPAAETSVSFTNTTTGVADWSLLDQ